MEQTKSATLLSSEEAASQNFSTDNKISGGCVKCGCEVLIYYHYDTGKPVPNAPFVLTDSNQHVIEGKTDQNGLCLIYDMGCGTFDLLLDEGSDSFEPKETVKNNPVMQSNPAYAAIAGEYFALFLLLHKQGLVEYDASSSSDRYVDVDGAGLFTSIPPEYRKAYDRFWELDEKINAGSLELRRAVNKIQHSLAAEVADKGEGGNAAIMLFCQIILGCIPVVGQAMDAYSIGEWCWNTYEEPVLLEDKLHVAEGVLNVIGLVPGLGDAMKVSGKAILKALKKVAPEEIQFAMKIIRKLSDGNLVKGISKMRAELSVYGQKALKLLEDMKAALQKALKSSADDGWIVALMKDRFHKMVDFLDKLYKTFSDTVAYIERKFDEFIPHVVTRKAGSARSKGSVAEAAEAPKTAPHAESRAGEPARAESAPNKPASENAAGDSTVPSSKKPTSKKSEGAGEDASSGAKSEPAPAEKKANATPEGSESINAGSSKEPKPDKTSQKKKADEAEGKCDANSNKCHKEGEPVDMATGFVVDWRTDFEVSGLLPLTMKRYYRSGGERKPGLLGALWRSNWDMCLELEQGVVTLTDGEFNQSTFVLPDEGEFLRSQANPEWRLSRQQGQLVLIHCDGLRYRFEHAMGKRLLLTSITDRVGHEISLLWERGVLRWIELPDRRLVHVETEKRRITQLTLCDAQRQPLQTLARYTWDQHGFLLSVRAGDGRNFDYRYSPEGWLLRWNDLAHTWVEHTYDEKGRSIQDRSSEGFWPGRFEYDDENLTSHYHSGFGGVVSYTRNERNYILCKRTADGGETHYEWQQSLLVAETDPLGNRTEYEHNDWGQITAVTLPDGAVHRYDYDDDGQLLAYTNPLGHVWQYQRNAQGQVVEVNDPEGREWLQSYTEQGLLATVIGPDGVLQRYQYNPQGFVSAIETDNLPAVRFFYDAQDRLTERHIARESGTQIRRWEYEGARQAPVRVVYEDGSATHFGYDVEGNLTSVLDALGQQHQFRYGAFDNLLESTDPLGATVRYHYNTEAEFAGVTNSHGDAWTYSFDECGRLSD
ncbi:DUF6531 domain-containing protein, partial [Lonsdalea iberica]|uniref:DUF6531 domain-containing protein n=1 Tax=Lonsdalea iberica TaxID=1082703 RepID=UPI0020CAC604